MKAVIAKKFPTVLFILLYIKQQKRQCVRVKITKWLIQFEFYLTEQKTLAFQSRG